MCSEPVTFGGGITMVKVRGILAFGPASPERAALLPDLGHAAFDV